MYSHNAGAKTVLDCATLTKRRGKDDSKADCQRAAHVKELFAGSTHGHGGQASHDACGVPGSPDHQWAAEESEGSDDGPHHTFKMKHNSLWHTAHFTVRRRREKKHYHRWYFLPNLREASRRGVWAPGCAHMKWTEPACRHRSWLQKLLRWPEVKPAIYYQCNQLLTCWQAFKMLQISHVTTWKSTVMTRPR